MDIVGKGFRKGEKLCSQKTIYSLFESGNIFYSGVLKVIWQANTGVEPVSKVAFGAPKKSFKFAVTRNLIKRRIRESYRNNKHILYKHISEKNVSVYLFFILTAKNTPDYKTIEKSVIEALNKLITLI